MRVPPLPIALALAVLALTSSGLSATRTGFVLTSPAFRQGGLIPRIYTCDGVQRIVPLRWTAPPRGTRSFALSVIDPDAPSGAFVHRLAWRIPSNVRALNSRAPSEGLTSAGRAGWVGPCPPSGTHHYVFRLYALRSALPLDAGADRNAFEAALRGRVLRVATLVGRYRR